MTVRNLIDMALNVSGILRELESVGLNVLVGDDFAEYRNYRLRQSDREHIYPMFDVASSYVDQSNGIWICGFSPDGALIHTQATRLLTLSGKNLDEHLRVHRHKYITPGTTPDPNLTYYRGPNALRTITNNVCYCGEFWLAAQGLGGPRSYGVTSLLARLAFELMYRRWQPDYTFAFVPKQLAAKGAHVRYGYSHCEPGQWIGPDQQVTEEDFLVWMNASELVDTLSRPRPTLENSAQLSSIGSALKSIDTKG